MVGLNPDLKIALLLESLKNQFTMRTVDEGRKTGTDFGIDLTTEMKEHQAWFTFTKDKESHTLTIPIPFVENGIIFIENNDVRRAVCNFYYVDEDREVDFIDIMREILLGDPIGLIPSYMVKKICSVQQIVYSFINGNSAVIIHNIQRAVNHITNIMPLHETNMNDYIMNNRLIILDPEFDAIKDPNDLLTYQTEKAKRFFARGWTAIGLSDKVMAEKNLILKQDLRPLSPFGVSFHNPQRNLYSSLGMKGDEEPLIRTKAMEILRRQGITRKGWNLFTAFVDVPDVWEDQILLDNSLRKLGVTYTRRIQCFGELSVKVGDKLKNGQPICKSPDAKLTRISFEADSMFVKKISEVTVNIGGNPTVVFNVIVQYRRNLKDGVKINNMAANKGVIRFRDLGYAVDPRDGSTRKIQVLVSSKAVQKRKNYSQILEALFNQVTKDKGVIINDDLTFNMTSVEKRLEKEGLPSDGTWMCYTYAGELEGVVGTVFWGVSKDVEDQLWEGSDTMRINGRGLRTAGLKLSHVEFRGITTRFGADNPIMDEIMSYAQGTKDLNDLLLMLRSQIGEIPEGYRTVDFSNVEPVDMTGGTILDKKCITGTVVDETVHPDGFIIKLPVQYQTVQKGDGSIHFEGIPTYSEEFPPDEGYKVYTTDRIFVPSAGLRRCWRHATGKWGLSEIGILVNNVVEMTHRLIADTESGDHHAMLYQHISRYFSKVAKMMGSKRGEIAKHGMAIRYPFSAKAVATLSNSLPKNTVQIHKNMAEQLDIDNGAIVLVERFPCLGFMSIRPQKIMVTNDPMCKHTIRASGNCLTSLGLDFDGDVIYLASFHTQEAKELLRKEWETPNHPCYEAIEALNKKAGEPHFKELTLQDYNIKPFPELTNNDHASCVAKLVGVKTHTGPVIALSYDIMRLIENSDIKDSQIVAVAIEVFLDRVGNSVFKQKHGVKSLHQIVTDAICTADVETLVSEEFDRVTSQMICDVIKQKARKIGVYNLKTYHAKYGNIIKRLIRIENKIYFASRSQLPGPCLLDYLDAEAVDVPSRMLKRIMAGKTIGKKTPFDCYTEEKVIGKCKCEETKDICRTLFECINSLTTPKPSMPVVMKNTVDERMADIYNSFNMAMKGGL